MFQQQQTTPQEPEEKKDDDSKIMYKYKIPNEHFSSSIFLGKYVEALFHTIYSNVNGLPKKRYIQIENIINSKHILTNVNKKVSDWFDKNNNLTIC